MVTHFSSSPCRIKRKRKQRNTDAINNVIKGRVQKSLLSVCGGEVVFRCCCAMTFIYTSLSCFRQMTAFLFHNVSSPPAAQVFRQVKVAFFGDPERGSYNAATCSIARYATLRVPPQWVYFFVFPSQGVLVTLRSAKIPIRVPSVKMTCHV